MSGALGRLGLFTDLYQLTMVEAYLREGMHEPAVFDLSVRDLPPTRNFLLMAGGSTVAGYLQRLGFDETDLSYLDSLGMFSQDTLDYLASFRFDGDLDAAPDGTAVFAGEPLLQVVAPLPQAQLIETFVINQIALQTMLASKGARVLLAAAGRTLIDFGSRRTHGIDAGLAAARALYLAGFDSTSNVLAGKREGIPVAGTMAHSFVQAHASELEAFRAFARRYPEGTLLVDTYDTLEGVRNVVRLAAELGPAFRSRAIRLDSGDLDALSRQARAILDQAGLQDVRVFASGGLDEQRIAELLAAGAPIDGFGVGTRVGTSADAPNLECVYKLAAYAGRGRVKRSARKATLPHRKQVFRHIDGGKPGGDIVAMAEESHDGEPLLAPVLRSGAATGAVDLSLEASRTRARASLAALPERLRSLQPAEPYPVTVSERLRGEAARIGEAGT